MAYRVVRSDLHLEHHGILGQKWGKQNGPPYPLGSGDHSASEKKAGWRKSLSNDSKSTKSSESKAQQSKTVKRKMTDAEKKALTKKVLIGIGAVTLTAAAVYVARNAYIKEFCDQTLKSGLKLQTITSNADMDMSKRFYAAYKNTDKVRYKGMLGMQKLVAGETPHAIKTTLTQDMKIPSRRKAAEVFANLYKTDADFKSTVDGLNNANNSGLNFIMKSPKQQKLFDTVTNGSMNDKTLLKQGYDAFNYNLVNHSPGAEKVNNQFFEALKKQGYSAIIDMNDYKYSGYSSKAPVIVFDTKGVVTEQVKRMSTGEVALNRVGADLINNGMVYAAEVGLMAAPHLIQNKSKTNKKDK